MSYFDEGSNPWRVDYQGNLMRTMQVNAVAEEYEGVIADYESKLQAWKKHAAGVQKDFDDVVKQRNQRECQAFAWRDTMKKLIEKHGLNRDEINAMYDEIRDSYYELTRAAGKPV